jgi:imidazolonepropionase-like amidohydrolase
MRAITCFTAIAFIAFAGSTQAAEDSWLMIPAEKLYSAPQVAPIIDGGVLLKNDRIANLVYHRSRSALPETVRTSDCRGVVVAGFQNSHVHFTEPAFENAATRPAAELERAVEAMLSRYGYTTVFDTASDQQNTLAVRARIEKGEVRGPRILTVGWPIYPPKGIPSYINDLPKRVLDKMHQPKSAEEARKNVRANLDGGADGTKIFMVTSPARDVTTVLSAEVARAAAEETHARGKLLFAHPTNIAGIRAALDAGVDILVHTTLGEPAPWGEELARQLVAKKVSVIPTFKLWEYELAKEKAPKDVVDRLVSSTLRELKTFVDAGGQVLFGTDVGYMHEYDPTDEYLWMSQAGMTPAEILASLTTAPAQRWKEDERRGRVAPGMDADIVVLAADPFEDVKNFAKVRCVYRAGKLIYASKESK